MPSADISSRLREVLNRELKLLEEYNRGCEQLHRELIARNWTRLEPVLNELRSSAAELEKRDLERESLISALKGDLGLQEECSFGLLLSCLDEESRRDIGGMKRKIRHCVSVLQIRLKGIGSYTDGQSELLKDMIGELVPASKGKIYNSRGTASSGESRPLLINHRL